MSLVPASLFFLRGTLAGTPEVKEFGKRVVTEFVLDQTVEYQAGGETRRFTKNIMCQANKFDVNPDDIANASPGDLIQVTGEIGGRRSDKNGRVFYNTNLEVKTFTILGVAASLGSATDDVPF